MIGKDAIFWGESCSSLTLEIKVDGEGGSSSTMLIIWDLYKRVLILVPCRSRTPGDT